MTRNIRLALTRARSELGSQGFREEMDKWVVVIAVILIVLGANAYGTALSSLRDEAAFASSPSGLQSTFAGEPK